MKTSVVIIIFLKILYGYGFAQPSPQTFIDSTFIQNFSDEPVFLHKKLDTIFQIPIKAALLFYPELKTAKITFKIKKSKSPLSARPSIWAIFQKPEKRRYYVVISNCTHQRLTPILLKNLSLNAQIGVVGHELSHIADFHRRNGGYFLKLLIKHLSKKAIDRFENETDRRCIEHGLGYQLLAWSTEVRQNLKIKQWHGADSDVKPAVTEGGGEIERYLSPTTIKSIIHNLTIYQ